VVAPELQPKLRPEDGLKHVLDAARAALDQEFARAERLDSKARGQLAAAASWFAAVQAVAGITLRSDTSAGWLLVVAALAAGSAICLLLAHRTLGAVWKLHPQPAIGEETLEDMAANAGSPTFGDQLVLLYRNLLGNAQHNNDLRSDALDGAAKWIWSSQLLALAELLAAFLFRLLVSG